MSVVKWMEDREIGLETKVPTLPPAFPGGVSLGISEAFRILLEGAVERGWINGIPTDAEIGVRVDFVDQETGKVL